MGARFLPSLPYPYCNPPSAYEAPTVTAPRYDQTQFCPQFDQKPFRKFPRVEVDSKMRLLEPPLSDILAMEVAQMSDTRSIDDPGSKL